MNFRLLREIANCNTQNNGTRTILESILIPEVAQAFSEFVKGAGEKFCLIGGIALSFYVKPRSTTDVDLLFLQAADIPDEISGFRRHRKGAYEHIRTGVEVEVLTPGYINLQPGLAQQVFNTSKIHGHVRVASASGLVALKLGRFSRQDQADIESLIKYEPAMDLSEYDISDDNKNKFFEIKNSI